MVRVEIGHTDLIEVVARRNGIFNKMNTGLPGTTEPWRRLQQIGLSNKSINLNFSGTVRLFIRRMGVRNADIPRDFSDIFKLEVFPAIKIFDPGCDDSFELVLHYSERLLKRVELVYKEGK